MNHDHEITHLDEIGRRRLLQISAIAIGGMALNSVLPKSLSEAATVAKLPGFSAFAKSVKVFRSGKYYLVESNGIPDHQMMVGIKAWQQQVPTPHPYTGTNAWPIPVTPVISKTPISAKNHFLRGAIAVAINGVPIFNALTNKGTDAYLTGELDDWGGHCGRADDYHYHMAPFHLQAIAGKKVPIAYALDGFPRIVPIPRKVIAGEFSTKTNFGLISQMILNISLHNPEFSPLIPAPFPAIETSWHGNPPQMMSILPVHGFPSNVRTSSQIGNLGRIPSRCRCNKTRLQYELISTAQTVVCPSNFPPRIPPPIPANKCNSFTVS